MSEEERQSLYDNAMAQVTTIDLSTSLTTTDLARMFGRSGLTILLWRKNKELPYIRIKGDKRDTIRYDKEAVLAWAKVNEKRLRL